MTVYFCNEQKISPRHKPRDISSALKYGSIDYVFNLNDGIPSRDPQAAYDHAKEVLEDFDPSVDMIAWSGGDPYALVAIAAVLGHEFSGFSYLSWDRTFDEELDRPVSQYVKKTFTNGEQHV